MASSIFVGSQTTHPIRPINVTRDMPQVMRLLNRVFSPTLDAEGRRALNSMGNKPALALRLNRVGQKIAAGFIYEHNHQVVGNVSIIPTAVKKRVIIANVAVHEDYRRRGVARDLMDFTLDHLLERGVKAVLLQVDIDNEGAHRLYSNLNFDVMGSTTYWVASPGSWRELPTPSPAEIRPMRYAEFRQAYDLDTSTFPIDLNWPDPINGNSYRQSLLRRLDQFFNGKSAENWVIANDNELFALGSIWSEWGRPHRLTLRVKDAHRDELLPPLFAKLLRRLRYVRRRHVSIEHPRDDDLMTDMLVSANFYAKRNLTTMKLLL